MPTYPLPTEGPASFPHHEIDLRGSYAGDYLKVGAHWFRIGNDALAAEVGMNGGGDV